MGRLARFNRSMRGLDWEVGDVTREFGEYCSIDMLKEGVNIVLKSGVKSNRINTYNKRMRLLRQALGELGVQDIPMRTNYYKKGGVYNGKEI